MDHSCTVYAVGDQIFICPERRDEIGLRVVYAVEERQTQEPAELGLCVQAALERPWPDIAPSPDEVFDLLLQRSGMKTARQFYRTAGCVAVEVEETGRIQLRPARRDGRGFVSVTDDPLYDLASPDPTTLGQQLLKALDDSERLSS